MLCPRCGKYTDDIYPNCVNCGYAINPPKPDETLDFFARALVWLIIIGVALSAIVTIIIFVFVSNAMNSLP